MTYVICIPCKIYQMICIDLYRGITECYDIQLIDLHVSTTDFIYII